MPTIEYSQVFAEHLDKHLQAKATSGFMEVNDDYIKYKGGNEVKIASIIMSGLTNYDRQNGFPKGAVSLSFETHKFTQDRARTFTIDAMDVDETNYALTAANLLMEFQKDRVVPEVDAYRYSKIAKIAADNGKATSYKLSAGDVLNKLMSDIVDIQDKIGDDRQLVIILSHKTAQVLNSSEKITKQLNVGDFKRGEVNMQVQTLNGISIIKVPSSRFLTSYIFNQDDTADAVSDGFTPAADAKPINWIIAAVESLVAVSKTEAIRIFSPNQNQNADAWKIDYRRYHDMWIPKNKLDGVTVSVAAGEGE